MKKTLASSAAPDSLQRVVCAMYEGLTVRVEIGRSVTAGISVKRGVLQGNPLSPLLFNLCINLILDNLNRPDIQRVFGFQINDDMALSAFAFADDLVGEKE